MNSATKYILWKFLSCLGVFVDLCIATIDFLLISCLFPQREVIRFVWGWVLEIMIPSMPKISCTCLLSGGYLAHVETIFVAVIPNMHGISIIYLLVSMPSCVEFDSCMIGLGSMITDVRYTFKTHEYSHNSVPR